MVHVPRRVPLGLRDRLKSELDKEESLGVIVKVDEPTDWVNSITIVEKKNGLLRICLDPCDLNKALKREHYSCPTVDDIAAKLHGARVFTVLDATSGYWQVKLDKKSSLLTTFNTPFGRYRFTRLPFGVNSAQDVFQKEIDLTCERLPGVAAIVDDILVYGKNQEDHDAKLEAVIRRTRERGIKLNPDKCVFRTNQVTYFGHNGQQMAYDLTRSRRKGFGICHHQLQGKSWRPCLEWLHICTKSIRRHCSTPRLDEEGERLHLGRSK